jgi:hypothetical protein
MELKVGDKPNEVHHEEATIHSSDDEAHRTEGSKHDEKNHNVDHSGGVDIGVTWKTWFVIMVCPSQYCSS